MDLFVFYGLILYYDFSLVSGRNPLKSEETEFKDFFSFNLLARLVGLTGLSPSIGTISMGWDRPKSTTLAILRTSLTG